MQARVGAGADEPAPAGVNAVPPRRQAADGLDSALAYLTLQATRARTPAHGEGGACFGEAVVSHIHLHWLRGM